MVNTYLPEKIYLTVYKFEVSDNNPIFKLKMSHFFSNLVLDQENISNYFYFMIILLVSIFLRIPVIYCNIFINILHIICISISVQ